MQSANTKDEIYLAKTVNLKYTVLTKKRIKDGLDEHKETLML